MNKINLTDVAFLAHGSSFSFPIIENETYGLTQKLLK